MSVNRMLFDVFSDMVRDHAASISPEYRAYRDRMRNCVCEHSDGWTVTPVPVPCAKFEADSVTGYCANCEHNEECHQ